ncbi:Hypp3216 [Branchiostoma lanceolatum]|uniref:Hypp3216 protein n=1 Tax=Branchiostoma lanceolatum TaxID=7740 RepID=A0A8K0A0P1_BRALA|nr:Hypp3216 [Branchiostoma lanceolatum]
MLDKQFYKRRSDLNKALGVMPGYREVQGKPIPSIGSATNHRPLVPYITEDFSEGHAEQPVTSSQTDFGETAEHQQYLEAVSSQLQASPHVSPGAKLVPVAGQPSCSQSSAQGQATTTPSEVAHPQVHLSPLPQEAPHTQPPQPHPSPQQPLHPPPYPVQATQPPQSPHTPHPAYPAASTPTQSFTPQPPYSQATSFPQQSPVPQTTPSPSYLPQSPYPPQSVPYSPAYHYPQQPPSPMVSVSAESSPQAQPSPHTQSFSPYPPYYSPQPQVPSPQGSATPVQPGYLPHFQFPESYPEMHGPPQMHGHPGHPGPEYYMGPPPLGMGPLHHPGMAPHPRGPFVNSPQPYSGPPLTPGGGAESDHSLSPGIEKEAKPVEKKSLSGSTSPRARIQRSKAAAGKRPVRPPPTKVQPPTPTPT